MSKFFDQLTPELTEFIRAQPVFFVATAPLADDGHVNCSPKGLDTFAVLGPRRVAYLDLKSIRWLDCDLERFLDRRV